MSYNSIEEKVENRELPLTYTNEDNEEVIIERGRDDNGNFYCLTTVQKNNWCRINHYYEDGTITETYEK